jgi:hypothetical protein
MVTLGRVLTYLYPDAEPGSDYEVRLAKPEDALEEYIAVWNLPEPEPTAAEIVAATSLPQVRLRKEAELRDAADSWYQGSVRSFESAIVTAKYGRGGLTALGTEERAIFDEMNANYTKLKNLIGQVRAATTVAEVEAVVWTP